MHRSVWCDIFWKVYSRRCGRHGGGGCDRRSGMCHSMPGVNAKFTASKQKSQFDNRNKMRSTFLLLKNIVTLERVITAYKKHVLRQRQRHVGKHIEHDVEIVVAHVDRKSGFRSSRKKGSQRSWASVHRTMSRLLLSRRLWSGFRSAARAASTMLVIF